jgi:hypothetical protein
MGVFQSHGALNMAPSATNTDIVYTQQFLAGQLFQFTVTLDGDYPGAPATPDAFTFQLYDAGLDTLLYEQVLAVTSQDKTLTPEPRSLANCLLGLTAMAATRAILRYQRA